MILPYSPEQVASWRRRDADGIEPLTLQLPGFLVTERGPEDGCLPNQRVFIFERGDARVEVTRHWDRPLASGHPMVIASTRKVTTSSGDMLEVHTANVFEWFPRSVEVVLINGATFAARVVFINCDQATVDDALARLSIRLGDAIDKHSGPYR
jgi:hypothetical protein